MATRTLFVAWALRHEIARREARLATAFPGFAEGDQEVPPGFLDSSLWKGLARMREVQQRAYAALGERQRRVLPALRSSAALDSVRRHLGIPIIGREEEESQ